MNRHAAALYRRAPVWGQNFMLTAFSALLDRERYGGRFGEFQELLEKTERLSEVAVLDPRSTYSLWSRMPSGPNAIHSPSGSARRMRRSTP